MSDSAISAGDLVFVMIAKACCDRNVQTPVFVVAELEDAGPCGCNYCGQVLNFQVWGRDGPNDSDNRYPLSWLKKIEPMDVETAEDQEKVSNG